MVASSLTSYANWYGIRGGYLELPSAPEEAEPEAAAATAEALAAEATPPTVPRTAEPPASWY